MLFKKERGESWQNGKADSLFFFIIHQLLPRDTATSALQFRFMLDTMLPCPIIIVGFSKHLLQKERKRIWKCICSSSNMLQETQEVEILHNNQKGTGREARAQGRIRARRPPSAQQQEKQDTSKGNKATPNLASW